MDRYQIVSDELFKNGFLDLNFKHSFISCDTLEKCEMYIDNSFDIVNVKSGMSFSPNQLGRHEYKEFCYNDVESYRDFGYNISIRKIDDLFYEVNIDNNKHLIALVGSLFYTIRLDDENLLRCIRLDSARNKNFSFLYCEKLPKDMIKFTFKLNSSTFSLIFNYSDGSFAYSTFRYCVFENGSRIEFNYCANTEKDLDKDLYRYAKIINTRCMVLNNYKIGNEYVVKFNMSNKNKR